VFQEPKAVGRNRGARKAISLQGGFAVFAEILTLPPLTIGVIEECGGKLWQGSYPKAGIGPVLADLRLQDHVARRRPALCRIDKGLEVLPGLLGGLKAPAGCGSGVRARPQQYGSLG
jgi:hypothetical protein